MFLQPSKVIWVLMITVLFFQHQIIEWFFNLNYFFIEFYLRWEKGVLMVFFFPLKDLFIETNFHQKQVNLFGRKLFKIIFIFIFWITAIFDRCPLVYVGTTIVGTILLSQKVTTISCKTKRSRDLFIVDFETIQRKNGQSSIYCIAKGYMTRPVIFNCFFLFWKKTLIQINVLNRSIL